METGGVFRIEALHGGHLRKSLVKGRDLRVPGAGAALFHGGVDGGGVCEALRSVAEQAFEDALMHAGEALRFQQRLHAEGEETLAQAQALFDLAGDNAQLLAFIAVQPFGDEVKAPRLMRPGDVALQTGERLLLHGARAGGEQYVTGQFGKFRRFIRIAARLLRQLPECLRRAEALNGGPGGVFPLAQIAQHGAQDGRRARILCAAERGHHRQMQLRRLFGLRAFEQGGDLGAALPGGEEFVVALHQPPQRRLRGQAHLLHPDGDEVGAERLAVQARVQQPIVLQRLIAEGTVDEEVAVRVLVQRPLDGEGVAPVQTQQAHVFRHEFLHAPVKLPLLILPEDHAPLVVFGEGGGKAPAQVEHDVIGVHGFPHFIFASTSANLA